MSICKKCFISGLVQGVFYRASSQSQAEKLGITGYAINLADGRVQVLACGENEKVGRFCDWLWTGSNGSRVANVQCESVKIIPPDYFTTAQA